MTAARLPIPEPETRNRATLNADLRIGWSCQWPRKSGARRSSNARTPSARSRLVHARATVSSTRWATSGGRWASDNSAKAAFEAAIVSGQDIFEADESYPLAPNSPYPYCATKAQAEQLVRAAGTEEFCTIVLRPRFIWGPGDTTLLPAIETMNASGGWAWVDHGRALTSSTHIDNLVHAISLALSAGKSGEAYFVLDDGARTIKDMITGMAASKGIVLPARSIPRPVADRLGACCEWTWRTFNLKGTPPLTRHAAMVMSRNCVLVDDRARKELGYAPVIDAAQGMKDLALKQP